MKLLSADTERETHNEMTQLEGRNNIIFWQIIEGVLSF